MFGGLQKALLILVGRLTGKRCPLCGSDRLGIVKKKRDGGMIREYRHCLDCRQPFFIKPSS